MDKKVEKFLNKLNELYCQIENFVNKYGLKYRYEEIQIYEEYAGKYFAKEMYVSRDGEFVFKLKPIGAYIIGADGRVDMIGTLDTKVIVYLEKLYKMEFTVSTELRNKEELVSTSSIPLYDGYEGPGWYISSERKKILPLNDQNICSILEEISEFSINLINLEACDLGILT